MDEGPCRGVVYLTVLCGCIPIPCLPNFWYSAIPSSCYIASLLPLRSTTNDIGKVSNHEPLDHFATTATAPCSLSQHSLRVQAEMSMVWHWLCRQWQVQYLDQYGIATALKAACAMREDFMAALVRLHVLLKPGGKTVLCIAEKKESYSSMPGSYTVGSQMFLTCASQQNSHASQWNRQFQLCNQL